MNNDLYHTRYNIGDTTAGKIDCQRASAKMRRDISAIPVFYCLLFMFVVFQQSKQGSMALVLRRSGFDLIVAC